MNILCHHCKSEVPIPLIDGRPSVAFRESCPKCSSDMHVCINCAFYDQSSHHECRETSAEWVRNKEKANTCEYFKLAISDQGKSKDSKADAMAALDALFKK